MLGESNDNYLLIVERKKTFKELDTPPIFDPQGRTGFGKVYSLFSNPTSIANLALIDDIWQDLSR